MSHHAGHLTPLAAMLAVLAGILGTIILNRLPWFKELWSRLSTRRQKGGR